MYTVSYSMCEFISITMEWIILYPIYQREREREGRALASESRINRIS